MKNLFDVTDKVIVVTGATGVLAGGAALYLQEQGATVVYWARRQEALDSTLESAKKISDNYRGYICDVLDQEALDKTCAAIMADLGKVDVLINGAGGNMPGATIGPDKDVFDLEMDDYSKVLDLNLKGTVMPTMVFARVFKEQGYGCVLNFSSMSAEKTLTRVLGYGNAKAAIDNFTKWMSTELAKKYGDKVRINAINPGFFVTAQNCKLLINDDGTYTERGQQVINKTPFNRFGTQEEVYGTMHYLISDASAFVSGAIVPVDGGFSAYSGV